MPAMLHSSFKRKENLYEQNIKPFLREAINVLASSVKHLDQQGRRQFINLIYRDTNRRTAFALKIANLAMKEIEKISPPDAGAVAANIVQLSPDLGIGTISAGQLLYAIVLYAGCAEVAEIDIGGTSENDNTDCVSFGFHVGKYIALNSIVRWICELSMEGEYEGPRLLLSGNGEGATVITQLFYYQCINVKNVLSGISSEFSRFHKKVEIISNQI